MKTDPETRKTAEAKMRADWEKWMAEHSAMVLSSEAAGKSKRVTAKGVADHRNEIMLYALVEAETAEAAAMAFTTHPHLGIPEASIEITEVRSMGPMKV